MTDISTLVILHPQQTKGDASVQKPDPKPNTPNRKIGHGLNYEKFQAIANRFQRLSEMSIENPSSSLTSPVKGTMQIGNWRIGNNGLKLCQDMCVGTEDEIVEQPTQANTAAKVLELKKWVDKPVDNPGEQVVSHWKNLYESVLNEYEGFKAQTELILQSRVHEAEQRVLVLLEETEKTRQSLEKEKFSLTSTCRDLNREKIALECEIRTLGDELEETRRKLVRLEEKVTKECDFHEGVAKIDERNFTAAPFTSSSQLSGDCRVESHVRLQTTVELMDRKMGYLENEIVELNWRNEQLGEEIKAIYSGHDAQVEDLKNLMNVYETQLQEERVEFQIKLAETQAILDAQENYMSEIDKYVKERESCQTMVLEKFNDYTAGLLDDSRKTLKDLEQKLEKSEAQSKDLTTSLAKAIHVIQKLKEQPKRFYNSALESYQKIFAIFSILPKNPISATSLQHFNMGEVSPFVDKGDLQQNYNDDDERNFEVILEKIANLHKDLTGELEFWKKEYEEKSTQLKNRLNELEINFNGDKMELVLELNTSRKKCYKYRRYIKKLRSKCRRLKTKRKSSNLPRSQRVRFSEPTNPPKNIEKEMHQRSRSSPASIPHTKDIAQLQKRHAKFSEILEQVVDKYVSHSMGLKHSKKKERVQSK